MLFATSMAADEGTKAQVSCAFLSKLIGQGLTEH